MGDFDKLLKRRLMPPSASDFALIAARIEESVAQTKRVANALQDILDMLRKHEAALF